MKYILYVTFLIFSIPSCFAQNILDALNLKEASIKKYMEGEHLSTDTIIDLSNGYYEEFYSKGNDTLVLRQAAIFNNDNGSSFLGVTVCFWDFVCFQSTTDFYEISKSKKTIKSIGLASIFPKLHYKDFLRDTSLLPDLKAHLLHQNLEDSDSYEDFEKYLKEELFDIKYSMPRKGTSIIAQLDVCDYYLSHEEWLELSKKYFSEISLTYAPNLKKFKKVLTRNKRP